MTLGLWKGQPIEELSREELLEMIAYLARDAKRDKEQIERMTPHVKWVDYLNDGGARKASMLSPGLQAVVDRAVIDGFCLHCGAVRNAGPTCEQCGARYLG